MSLLGQLTQAVLKIATVLELVQNCKFSFKSHVPSVVPLVGDAYRFILSHRSIIERAPLQVYASALVFSPTFSTTRQNFKEEIPSWISKPPVPHQGWSRCLQTLESPGDTTTSLAVSSDNKYLACGMSHGTVKLWHQGTGALRSTLSVGDSRIMAVAFSQKKLLATINEATIIQIFDPVTGKNLQSKYLSSLIEDKSLPVDR